MNTRQRSGHESRSFLAALVVVALASGASAQFDAFEWTHVGDPAGSGTVTATQMDIVGPAHDECTTGDIVSLMITSASQSGTVQAHVYFDNQDGGFGWWTAEDPVYVIDGELTYLGPGDFFEPWEDDVSFHVETGESFGFGVQPIDCAFGPGVMQVTAFTFTPDTWQHLGQSLDGTHGAPVFKGIGPLQPGTPFTLSLVSALQNATAVLVLGSSAISLPFKGGVLVPSPVPPGLILALVTDGNGRIVINDTWPTGLPSGISLYMQYWIQDPGGPVGWSASNALEALLP